ncbi:D-alanyl-D-alanine carboxypeptidase [Pleomorphomonas koreensis]|uniref:D-alanyl-D-alanine carboxypeptidase n=1 Tax=Pleomorphomonas koreensis TaxID=257440 RepID=UPI000566A78D|nr:D-alanyl-D-alanine carboxypeptidase [Pleomorphomonas koreensis]
MAAPAAAVIIAAGVSGAALAAKEFPSQVVPSKYAAIVVDTATGKVLYQANPDAARYPASLTKMMTLYVLFEELDRGRFKLSTPLRVSALAQRQSPTKLGLRAGETITVEDAIKGLITRSANDAAAVIAENVAGSVPAFAERMTRTARAIGMTNTRFRNANGLPDPGQYTSARDMMKLGVALQVRFPQYYPLFSIRSYTFRGRTIGNHNNLLGRVNGVDGIKTGYVNASGFNLVTSVKRDGRKIVAVVMGGKTAAQRDAHMVQLINTYLPKASRARGYDDDLVADAMNAPKVAAASAAAPAEPARLLAASTLPPHPAPVPRPMAADAGADPAADPAMITASAAPVAPLPPVAPDVPAPVVVAAAAAAPAPQPAPEPVSLATATLPASLANARLPSSAAEAFADIGPAPQGDPMADLVARVDAHSRKTAKRGIEVASAAPANVMTDAPAAQPEASAAARPSGWYIQIGAVGSKAAAMDLLDKAKSAAPQLAAADPFAEPVSKGGSTVVRARFGGFENEKAANKACAALKKSDFACFTIRL